MPALSVLIKPSSGMCNLACDYCFYCDEMAQREMAERGFMTEDTLRQVIKRTMLRAEDSVTFAFQGGEPTLIGTKFFEKVLEFEKKYNKNHLRVENAFQTNGVLLDENWCEILKKGNFLVGVSVDGTQVTHDIHRLKRDGSSVYERILHSIKLLEQYEIDFNILTVVNAQTAADIENIYGYYREKGWGFQQYIACLDPIGQDENAPHKPWSLTPELYGEFLVKLFDLWYSDWKKGKQPYIRTFENYIAMLLGYPAESCDQRGQCSIQYCVEADGSVYPCDFYAMDEYKIGNFNENVLAEVDRKRKEIRFVEASYKIPEECRSCPHYLLCRNGCRRMRLSDGKNRFCESYKKFFKECGGKMHEIAAAVRAANR